MGAVRADLRGCACGPRERPIALGEACRSGCRLEGVSGVVTGPAYVGADMTDLLNGADLAVWPGDVGAPDVEAASL